MSCCAALIAKRGAESLTFILRRKVKDYHDWGGIDGWGLYCYSLLPRWIQVKATIPQQFNIQTSWRETKRRRRVKEDFKSWRRLLRAGGSETQYLRNRTSAFCFAFLFLHCLCQPRRRFHTTHLSLSLSLSLCLSSLATIENDVPCSGQAEKKKEREERIRRRITRQIDQEVVELSMQRITAVTTCDHRRRSERQGDRTRVTAGGREGGRDAKNRWGGRDGRGGVVESKERIEQWRESMFPMRSIELSIILLQPVDGSSRNEEGERGREEGGDANRSPAFFAGQSGDDGEPCAAMQMYCPVCLAGAGCRGQKSTRHRREREK